MIRYRNCFLACIRRIPSFAGVGRFSGLHRVAWLGLILGGLAAGGLALVSRGDIDEDAEFGTFNLSLDEIPGVHRNVHHALENQFVWGPFGIQSTRGATEFLFDVQVSSHIPLSEHRYILYGTAHELNLFIQELQFINSRASEIAALRRSAQFAKGSYDGVESLVLDTFELITRPDKAVKSVWELRKVFPELLVYSREVWSTDRSAGADLKAFLQEYWEGKLEDLAQSEGLSYANMETAEARQWIEIEAKSRLAGEFLPEIATLAIAWAKIPKIAKAGKVTVQTDRAATRVQNAGKSSPVVQGSVRSSQSGRVVRKEALFIRHATILSSLVDPAKVSTLSVQAAKMRHKKVLYWMHQAETAHPGQLAKVLDEAFSKSAAATKNIPLRHDPDILKRQLLRNYDEAKNMGLFDTRGNLDSLRRGHAPVIQRGSFRGEGVHIDHIVPLAHAPMLGNNLGNLRTLPASRNLSRGAKLDGDARLKMGEFSEAGIPLR